MHLNTLLLFEKYCVPVFKENFKILEIGPDSLPSSCNKKINSFQKWDTLEIESSENNKTTYISPYPYNYPVPDSEYDIVLACNVMEHVADIWKWLKELRRIIKPGGYVILIAPTSYPFHEEPIDCWRIYPDGMKILASNSDFNILLALNESLEPEYLKKLKNLNFIAGRTCFHNTAIKGLEKINFYNGLIKHIPKLKHLQVPTEVAFDMVTILQKPFAN